MKFSTLVNRFVEYQSQLRMYNIFFMAAILALMGGVMAVELGLWPLLMVGMQVMTLGITALLRLWPERSLDRSFIDPAVMSYAFVLGGGAVLPFALWFAGRGRMNTVLTSSEEAWMTLSSLVAALVVMAMFYRVDSQRYYDANWQDALTSPSKVWINFVIVPVSSAMFTWLLAPQIVLRVIDPERVGAFGDTFIALLLMAPFVGFLVYDKMNPPDPKKQHIRWNTRAYKPADMVTF
jgi:hypothetical protein